MGMVKLPEKELATAFAAADYILIVQKRTDGKLDIPPCYAGAGGKGGR